MPSTPPPPASAARSVLVVGGGVIGLACAYELAREGHRVRVLDAGEPGQGASRGNAGWVVPGLATPLAAPGMLREGLRHMAARDGALVIRPTADPAWIRWLWQFRRSCSAAAYARGVRALVRLTRDTFSILDRWADDGVAFEQHAAGVLAVALDPHGLDWFAQLFAELQSLGFEGGLERYDADAARELEPALADAVRYAMRTTLDRHVRPESLVAGLANAAQGLGVEIVARAPVAALTARGSGWQLAVAGEQQEAEVVVLAAGVGSASLLRSLGVRAPLVGARGYSVDIVGEGTVPRHAVYLCEPKVGLSPFDGGLRVAGVFELPARERPVDQRRVRAMVVQSLPFLRDWRPPAELPAGWAGLRPATPDSLPLLGAVAPGLIVAAGHGMLGVTLAPATGVAVADLVAGRDTAWLAPFDPRRRP